MEVRLHQDQLKVSEDVFPEVLIPQDSKDLAAKKLFGNAEQIGSDISMGKRVSLLDYLEAYIKEMEARGFMFTGLSTYGSWIFSNAPTDFDLLLYFQQKKRYQNQPSFNQAIIPLDLHLSDAAKESANPHLTETMDLFVILKESELPAAITEALFLYDRSAKNAPGDLKAYVQSFLNTGHRDLFIEYVTFLSKKKPAPHIENLKKSEGIPHVEYDRIVTPRTSGLYVESRGARN